MDTLTVINGLVGGVHLISNIVITQFAKNNIKFNATWSQATAWFISVGIAIGLNQYNLGIFNGLDIYATIGYGMVLGLMSNGVFDIKMVQSLLSTMTLMEKKPNA